MFELPCELFLVLCLFPAATVNQIWKQIDSSKVPQDKRPGIGVAVFVLSEKHPESILLGRRKNTIGHGLYQVPGGHLEFGESWEQAAYREVLEETGLHVHNVSLCSIVDTIEPEQDYHYMTVFMRGYVDETRGSEPRNMEPQKCDGACTGLAVVEMVGASLARPPFLVPKGLQDKEPESILEE
ncbi:hypothetical protein HPB48_007696 [Haemaphysalis longicornis]|uniref:Nudix hydrolase domain-containing protein n=1 Tax=Haemaphysalis longicornis TaxID=44386 RepID=A0A9J6G4W6_HAELO|nr:hypothetical protein HPB48_007696 [Haemaphysalis longicornis]